MWKEARNTCLMRLVVDRCGILERIRGKGEIRIEMEKWLPGLWSVSFALLLDWRRSRAGVDEIGFKRVIRQFETVEDAAPLQLARWVQMTDRISGFGVDDGEWWNNRCFRRRPSPSRPRHSLFGNWQEKCRHHRRHRSQQDSRVASGWDDF
ncbi:hypothetical protein BKA81DRAFT_219562 [Phyllosticta paracitricarpa]